MQEEQTTIEALKETKEKKKRIILRKNFWRFFVPQH
jgi:hypothetical protein